MTKEQRIIVCGTKWCPDCRRACKIFKEREMLYEYVDINRNLDARAYVEKVNNGYRSVPTILFSNGDILIEPSNSALNTKLHALMQSTR